VLRNIIGSVGTLIAILALFVPSTARAGEHRVDDQAGLLRPGFVKLADEVIDDIHARTNKDLMIETFDTIPDEMQDAARQQDKQAFYDHWVNTEARKLGVNGVFILITKVPPHIQVGVGLETRTKAFTFKDRDELIDRMTESFHNRQFDKGLMDAVNFVRQRMAANLGLPLPREIPSTQPASAPATEPAGFNK